MRATSGRETEYRKLAAIIAGTITAAGIARPI
jgi:hypothetical protein